MQKQKPSGREKQLGVKRGWETRGTGKKDVCGGRNGNSKYYEMLLYLKAAYLQFQRKGQKNIVSRKGSSFSSPWTVTLTYFGNSQHKPKSWLSLSLSLSLSLFFFPPQASSCKTSLLKWSLQGTALAPYTKATKQAKAFGGGHTHSMPKFPSQGLNLCHSSNQSHSNENTRSFTWWATPELFCVCALFFVFLGPHPLSVWKLPG